MTDWEGRETNQEFSPSRSQPVLASNGQPEAEPSALVDLLSRVDEASGPDRELDARIWCWSHDCDFIKIAVSGDRYGDLCEPGDRGHGWSNTITPGQLVFRHRKPQERANQTQCYGSFPAHTASLDAALALVERVLPGCEWFVGRKYGQIDFGDDGPTSWAHAETTALALLAAMLKALIAVARKRSAHSSPRQVERADSRDTKKSIPKDAGKESAP